MSLQIKEKLNKDLGFYYWKYYIAGAFWSNIATPINLFITILSAIISAQANTEKLIPENVYKDLSIALLLLSTLNTFLRPHIQMNENVQMKNKYDGLGSEFERIHFSDKSDEEKLLEYDNIATRLNEFRISESPVSQNYLTDLIHIICRESCLKKRNLWLDFYADDSDIENDQSS